MSRPTASSYKVPRCWWEATRRKRADGHLFSRRPAGQAPHPMAQPAGSAEGRAAGPASWAGVTFQGFSELLGGRNASPRVGFWRLGTESFSSYFDNLLGRRHDAEERKCAPVHDRILVHQNLELTIAAVDHGNIGSQLAPQACRHTGGVDSGDSVTAVADRDAGHRTSIDR